MLGFESEEIEKEFPRIEKAFAKMGVIEEDLKICQKRLSESVDLSLVGMRKILQIFFKEMIDLVLAGDEHEKVVYTTLPGWGGGFVAPIRSEHPEIYAQCVDMLTAVALHPLFNKQVRCLEAGEKYLPAGNVHCAGFRTLLGAMDLGIFAKPDLIISWGIYCDEGPKVSAFIAEKYNVPIVYIDQYQDFPSDEKVPLPRYVNFVASEMKKAFQEIQKVLGIKISEDLLMKTIMTVAGPHTEFAAIQQMMLESDPVPFSIGDLMFAFTLHALTCSPENEIIKLDALKTLRKEIKRRVKQGEGPLKKGTPRILDTVPSFSDPTSNHIFQECGLQVAGTDMAIYAPDGSAEPDLSDCKDFYTYVAKTVMAVPATAGSTVRKVVLSALVKRYKIDGIILDPSYSCRLGFSDCQIIKNFIDKELHIPVMIMEHDVYDPRLFTPGQIRTRIETFAEQVRVYQESKKIEN
ncbi:MAG: 2-hydroxyacyl-CoA dehydratase family protein, partial [Candidatus Helarchaeota archaeon]|nr:2-hydroxyacyl-CoA dehydratase family protein [Candidatus Helarchaeota archaeon]